MIMKVLDEIIITAQKMRFSIKDFFSKCDHIRSFLRIWSHLLKKALMENFIFCAVKSTAQICTTIFLSLSLPLSQIINFISLLQTIVGNNANQFVLSWIFHIKLPILIFVLSVLLKSKRYFTRICLNLFSLNQLKSGIHSFSSGLITAL